VRWEVRELEPYSGTREDSKWVYYRRLATAHCFHNWQAIRADEFAAQFAVINICTFRSPNGQWPLASAIWVPANRRVLMITQQKLISFALPNSGTHTQRELMLSNLLEKQTKESGILTKEEILFPSYVCYFRPGHCLLSPKNTSPNPPHCHCHHPSPSAISCRFFSFQTMAQMLKCTLFLTFFEFDKRSQKIMMMGLMPGC